MEQAAYGFDTLPEQEHVVRVLTRWIETGRLPHALLLEGTPGTGKHATALTLMMALNCAHPASPTRACGQCRSCRKLLSGGHPDFLVLEPKNGVIRIDAVRELISRMIRKPHEARRRIVLVANAESLNHEASNALLKVLEEPPANSHFVLTATAPEELLETIRSRCQRVRFLPVSEPSLLEAIPTDQPEDARRTAARISGGSPDRAKRLALPAMQQRRTVIIRRLAEIARSGTGLRMHIAEWLSPDREHAEEALELMEWFFRDVAVFPEAPDRIFLCDHAAEVEKATRAISMERALVQLDAIRETRKRIQSNAAPRLSMEKLLLTL